MSEIWSFITGLENSYVKFKNKIKLKKKKKKTDKEGLESENEAAFGIWKQLLVYSQQENGDISRITTRNWILLTTQMDRK